MWEGLGLKLFLTLFVVTVVLAKSDVDDKVLANKNTCEMPQDNGRKEGCDNKAARKTRYYYNCDTHKCKSFEYEGCDGNKNNFDTQEDCEDKCIGKQKKRWCTPQKEDSNQKRGQNVVEEVVNALQGLGRGGGGGQPGKGSS